MWQLLKGWGAKALTALGIGTAVATGTVATVATGVTGPDGVIGRTLTNAANTVKNVDAVTDVDNFFTRIARFLQNFMKLLNNFGDVLNGKVNALSFFSGQNDGISGIGPGSPTTTPGRVVSNVLDNNAVGRTAGRAIDTVVENPMTSIAATTATASAVSRFRNGSWNPLNVFSGTAPASVVAQTADDATRGLGSRLLDGVKNGLSRLPGVGKLFGGAAVVVGGGIVANSVLSTDASATPSVTTAAPVNRTPSGVPAIAPVVSETAPTARSLAVNAINGAYSGTFNGVATFAGAPVDGATWLINKTVGRGLGFQIDRPFLGSESINNGLTGLRGAYHRAIGNDLDLVTPSNTAERIAHDGASLAGNVAASGGALGLLRGAWAKVASGVFTPAAPVSHAAPMSRPALVGGTMDGFHMN